MNRKICLNKIFPNSFSLIFPRAIHLAYVFRLLLTAYCLLFPLRAIADQPSQVCFNETCLTVEIADTDEERMRGLQGRTSLPEDRGMLFIFPDEHEYHFWMKDTLIALDMIFIDQEGKVVSIQADAPPCQADPCPEYGPSEKALYVLEANAGYAARMGLKVGDEVAFK